MIKKNIKKYVCWESSSLRDLKSFHEDIVDEIGHTLWKIQSGKFPKNVKQLRGFANDGVYEIIASLDKDTYRTVIALKIADEIYVLHCFKKKSKRGISTPQSDIKLIRQRLKAVKKRLRNEKAKKNKDGGRKRGSN